MDHPDDTPIRIGVFLESPARVSAVTEKLQSHPDLIVVARASSFDEFIGEVTVKTFDVSITRSEAMELASMFRANMPRAAESCTTRLFLTEKITVGEVVRGVHTGYDNYLLNVDDVASWHETIVATIQGQSHLRKHPLWSVAGEPVDMTQLSMAGFADLDRDILDLVSEGLPNEQIADLLCLSCQTVRNRVSRLMNFVGVNNRTQLSLVHRRSRAARPAGEDDSLSARAG